MVRTLAELDDLVTRRSRATTLAHQRTLPVPDPLAPMVPGGALMRGHVVVVRGVAEVSLALVLSAQATGTGSWLAVVEQPGVFELGPGAAAELGVVLDRTVLVAMPHSDTAQMGEVIAALIEGFDMVIIAADMPLAPEVVRRLQARLRSRGGVLVVVGGSGRWQPDLVLWSRPVGPQGGWEPLGDIGRLHRRQVLVEVDARRRGATKRWTVWLPTGEGSMAVIDGGHRIPVREVAGPTVRAG